MKELKEKHIYLIDYFETLTETHTGLQEILILKVTDKAIKIFFKDLKKHAWIKKENKNVKINIIEDIT
jgi:hypothetical protein